MNCKSVITFIFEVVASYVAFSSMIGVYILSGNVARENVVIE